MAEKTVSFKTAQGTKVTCGLSLAKKLGYSEPKTTKAAESKSSAK